MAADDDKRERPEVVDLGDERQVREMAIRQLERKRRFWQHAVSYAAISVVLAIVWAISEYNNAGGWPTDGFSDSSGTAHVWNVWIVYPVVGLGVFLAIEAWKTFVRKPITESEIRRQMDRLKGAH